MPASSAPYDHIGSLYDDYARTATIRLTERYTMLRMVGKLDGQHVLDLACGFGFYTRLLKERGAAQVVGVDDSEEMIRLARAQELAAPLGLTYLVADALALPPMGPFDLVTAVFLLPYAASKDQLLGMFQRVYDNLVDGGRFIAYTDHPEFSTVQSNCTKYGVTILRQEPEEDRYACEAEFAADPPFRVQWYQWNRASYEWALQQAGFQSFTWYPSEVAPEDMARYGKAYWQDFYDNCPTIGLICQK
jgi:ubiquinone/menaquinone biosynthesis C-methylase UbiE